MSTRITRRSLATLLPFAVAGCLPAPAKSPVRFYGLEPVIPPPAAADGPVIALTRVSIPAYLDRQALVVRSGPGRFELLESDNWLEPLPSAIARAFGEDLARLLRSRRLHLPEQDLPEDPDLRIALDLFRFEPEAGQVVVDARVHIARRRGRMVELREEVRVPVPPPGDAAAMVRALSEALGELARRTAARLQAAARADPRTGSSRA